MVVLQRNMPRKSQCEWRKCCQYIRLARCSRLRRLLQSQLNKGSRRRGRKQYEKRRIVEETVGDLYVKK